jgi:glycosyltransferase involved in cell wall biosynthesis
LKILLIYYEPQPSGQTTHVLSLAKGLDHERHEVIVVLPQCLSSRTSAFEQTGAQVVSLPLRKGLWPFHTMQAVIQLIREKNFDIVHVHSQEAGLVARPLAWIAGAPVVLYTPQTVDIRRTRWYSAYTQVERALAHITDVIISVAEADHKRMIQWGIPVHKTVTIPNGIDLQSFTGPVDREELCTSLGISSESPLVIQMGRLREQKDPLSFVEGAARVLQKAPGTQFVLLGDGPLRSAVEERIQSRGLVESVLLTGWRNDARELLAAADIVTLTSRWEGIHYELLEAMAWSRPVVATAVNGCPEVVHEGQTGYLVSPGDVFGWADRVLYLLANHAAATAMGQRGRERVEEHFALQKMVNRVEKLYYQTAKLSYPA